MFKDISDKDIKQALGVIRKMSQQEKDWVLAYLAVSSDRMADFLKKFVLSDKTPTKKDKEEIEHIISLGPPWLRYTHRRQKSK